MSMEPSDEVYFRILDRTACRRLIGAFGIWINEDEKVTQEDVDNAGPWGPEGQLFTDPKDFVWYSYDILKYDRKTRQWSRADGGLFLGVWPDNGAGAEAFINDCMVYFDETKANNPWEDKTIGEIEWEDFEEYRELCDEAELKALGKRLHSFVEED